jgi:CheY-like chemotaxis protein
VTLGCRVTAVADGDAAVTVCLRERPEVLVLDVNLPGKDGIEVARLLSRQAERPRIIGCSAEAFAETREAALAAGMDLFLEKPVTLEALAAALGRPEAGALAGNIFEHLNQPALLRRTRDLLQTEWPDWQAEVRTAAARTEADVVGRLAHRWLSHAALLHDETLAETLKALRTSAEAGAWSEIEARLSAVDTARQAAGG